MIETMAMVLAGGQGSRLTIFSSRRAKPAVPFGGIYRIIDFSLSNVMHAGIPIVGVLTQYRPSSLMSHLSSGAPWDLIGRKRQIKVLPPYTGTHSSDWYKGTADAIYQNLWYIRDHHPHNVLMLSGDHIYKMDYLKMLEYHALKNADLTIATMHVPLEEASRFGIMTANGDNRIVRFQEKPATPESTLASMGVYVFKTDVLLEKLETDARDPNSQHDFGSNLIPSMIAHHQVFNYVFEGYWRDVGTVQSYVDANMDMLDKNSGLDIGAWGVRTNLEERNVADHPPAKFLKGARVSNALISRGCVIKGTVERSILSPGVIVEEGAIVRNSVIMHDCHIQKAAVIENVVSDKDVIFRQGCQIGVSGDNTPNQTFPKYLTTGITIVGKEAIVPENIRIERNCVIFPGTTTDQYLNRIINSGQSVGHEDL